MMNIVSSDAIRKKHLCLKKHVFFFCKKKKKKNLASKKILNTYLFNTYLKEITS